MIGQIFGHHPNPPVKSDTGFVISLVELLILCYWFFVSYYIFFVGFKGLLIETKKWFLFSFQKKGNKLLESKYSVINTSFSYDWDSSMTNAVYSITAIKNDGSKKKVIYDGLNREIRTIVNGFNGEDIYKDTFYDTNGLVKQKSFPYKAYSSLAYLISYEYDLTMRLTKRIEPAGYGSNVSNSFLTTYDGFNIINQDTLGSVTIQYKNVLDQIVMVQDALGGIASYTYDSLNNIVKIVDSQGIVTSLQYNLNGKITQRNDPYMGKKPFYCYLIYLNSNKAI